MAKKAAAQQIQAEISTNAELTKFLEKPGVLVMDVYTEWCGPCLAMAGPLKKIKLEFGGDNLQLAICKSDKIDDLERFRNNSEPTWLFASNKKAINLMFGANAPKLMTLIKQELKYEEDYNNGKYQRKFYEISERQPSEVIMYNAKMEAIKKAKQIELETAIKERCDYLQYVANIIIENLPNYGITIFGPHMKRDVLAKSNKVAEPYKISSKDRKYEIITKSKLETLLYFEEKHPFTSKVLDYINEKEHLIYLWVLNEDTHEPIEEILIKVTKKLTEPQDIIDEYGIKIEDNQTLPILQALEYCNNCKGKSSSKKPQIKTESMPVQVSEIIKENLVETKAVNKIDEIEFTSEKQKEDEIKEIIIIPAMWTPIKKITHALGVYVFYRSITEKFLPPDPIPEPPHIAMAFDAYKKEDVLELAKQEIHNVLAFGYFTSADPLTAKLITNSTNEYMNRISKMYTDKIIVKIAERDYTILNFKELIPAYESINTVKGKEDCLKFFPERYESDINEKLSIDGNYI